MPSLRSFTALLLPAVLAGFAFGQDPATAQPAPAEMPSDEAETLFLERLNTYVQQYLSDAPTEAREFQDAVRMYQSEQANQLLHSLNLPAKPGLLTPEQVKVLERIELRYRDTDAGATAVERLREHNRILQEPEAEKALTDVGLGQPDEPLTEAQITALSQLRDQYPVSDAAKTASNYLTRHRQREANRVLREMIDGFLKTPGAPEAIERFANRRLEFALTLVDSQRVHRLEELVKNFPDTEAAARAKVLLEELNQKRINSIARDRAAAERSARYREHWDRAYPPRTWKPAQPPRS